MPISRLRAGCRLEKLFSRPLELDDAAYLLAAPALLSSPRSLANFATDALAPTRWMASSVLAAAAGQVLTTEVLLDITSPSFRRRAAKAAAAGGAESISLALSPEIR